MLIAALKKWYDTSEKVGPPLINSVKVYTMETILPLKKDFEFSFVGLLVSEEKASGPGGSHSMDELYGLARRIFERAVGQGGFKPEQVEPGILVDRIGNTYSGSSPLGFSHILDIAKKDDRVLLTSYGSGAGSDSFSFVVTNKLEKAKKKAQSTQSYIDKKQYINYSTYLKFRGKIRTAEP